MNADLMTLSFDLAVQTSVDLNSREACARRLHDCGVRQSEISDDDLVEIMDIAWRLRERMADAR